MVAGVPPFSGEGVSGCFLGHQCSSILVCLPVKASKPQMLLFSLVTLSLGLGLGPGALDSTVSLKMQAHIPHPIYPMQGLVRTPLNCSVFTQSLLSSPATGQHPSRHLADQLLPG